MSTDLDFAEKLMSTFYLGGGMSEEDYEKCEAIWKANDNDRSKVLKIVVELCGDIDSPQARYLRAIAWAFNRMEYSEEKIKSINEYLNNELYEKEYSKLATSLENGLESGKRFHQYQMLKYLAEAYCHLKDYANEEKTYIRMYELKTVVPNGCVALARFYAKRGSRNKAIELLKENQRTQLYASNEDYRKPIDTYLTELEKKEVGINKHVFVGYDTYQSAFINGEYYPEIEKKSMEIRKKYKNVFDYHREFLEGIDSCEFNIKNNIDVEESKRQFNTYCLSDINIYPEILKYYDEINSLGFEYKTEYRDNSSTEYPIFRKLISFYEKEKNYSDAIKLCDIAMNYGINKYLGKISMADKKNKLQELANK